MEYGASGSSGSCQDGNTSSRVIAEVKHLELNQFSDGSNLLGSGKCCCKQVRDVPSPWLVHSVRTHAQIRAFSGRFFLPSLQEKSLSSAKKFPTCHINTPPSKKDPLPIFLDLLIIVFLLLGCTACFFVVGPLGQGNQ